MKSTKKSRRDREKATHASEAVEQHDEQRRETDKRRRHAETAEI